MSQPPQFVDLLYVCDDHCNAKVEEVLNRFARAENLSLSKMDAENSDAAVVIVDPDVSDPLRAARKAHRSFPSSSILMVACSEQQQKRMQIPVYAMLGSSWQMVRLSELESAIRRALEVQWVQRRHRTALARMNLQLQKRMAEPPELRRFLLSDRYLATLLNCTEDAILSLDATGRIVTWNTGAEKLFEFSATEVRGRTLDVLLQGVPEDLGRRTELFCRRSDGSVFPAEMTSGPITDEQGHQLGRALILRDVSERKAAELEITRAREAAESASRAKSSFLANMSHEIRTPLSAILGFAELLTSEELGPEDRRQYLDVIRRNGDALLRLIDDVLDLSKVEAGKLTIEKERVFLSSLLSDILTLLSVKAQERNNELFLETSGPLPESVETDGTRLRQILLNIVGNAIKFTSHGTVTVRVGMVCPGTGEPLLEFLVKDTGRGIPPEHQGKLFQPFSQGDGSTTRSYGGTGLGLVLSRSLAEKLGGTVELLQSTLHEGSVFRITIATGSLESVPMRDALAVGWEPQKSSLREHGQLRPGLEILVGEDAPDTQLLLQNALRLAGANVTLCENGRHCLRVASQKDYDVILLDVQMPLLDGLSATRILRERGVKVPIIALTAHAMKEDEQKSLEAGCSAHLAKPIDFAKLISTINELTAPA